MTYMKGAQLKVHYNSIIVIGAIKQSEIFIIRTLVKVDSAILEFVVPQHCLDIYSLPMFD